ncbi:MAG: FAD-dependent oxidoreductase, partial [Candidatus Electrothrix sp. AR3]|nr:FAD-dependent oxidoreductase [Candidatus Electrothrix sp. AR3]
QGGVRCVRVRDALNGETYAISARLTINSAGPAAQVLNRSVPELQLRLKKKLTGFARGVHLVTRQVHSKYALALTSRKRTEGFVTRGGRHFFIIPWRERSLIGTTNVPFEGDLNTVKVTSRDVDDFLDDINDTLPELQLSRKDVYYAFTGLYPLVVQNIQPDKYQGTGEYQLVDHQVSDGSAGVITSLGAKYTTARRLAEKTVDLAAKKFKQKRMPCRTASIPLLEGSIRNLNGFIARKEKQYNALLPEEGVRHLIQYYGTGIDRVMEVAGGDPELLQPLSSLVNTLAAEVLHAVRKEMAMTLEDVIFRRTGMGTVGRPDDQALDRAAEIMATEL